MSSQTLYRWQKQYREKGEVVSERTVGKYMKEMGIRTCWTKRWIKTTINSDFSNELKNILERDFKPSKPNTVWVSDITYIWIGEGFVYLTSVMDIFSRKIISWTLSKSMELGYVIDAINKAKRRRKLDSALVIHSDRGSQYVSKEYKKVTENMSRSYSKKGDPWDNACIEVFHSLIKREWLKRFRIENYEMPHRLVFKYVETFYNTVRIHSYCGYISPNEYEKLYKKVKSKGYKEVS